MTHDHDPVEEEFLTTRYVLPFHARWLAGEKRSLSLATDLADAGRAAGPTDVIRLLASPNWRMQLSGAHFCLVHQDPDVAHAVERALRASRGWLTFPELCVAAVLLIGRPVIPTLRDYQVDTLQSRRPEHSSVEFASTAIDFLGGESTGEAISTSGSAEFDAKLAFARQIRSR